MKYSKFMFAASLVLTSCGAAAGAQVPAWKVNSQVDVPTVKVGRNWRSTLEILPTDAQNKTLYDAWQNEISRCMASHGYKYDAGIFYSDSWLDNWNPLDEKWGNQFGYHSPRTDFPQPEQPTENDYQEMLEGKCAPEANESTFGIADVEAYTTELDRLINEAMRVISEPGSTAETLLEAKWSACMAKNGFNVAKRHELVQEFQSRNRISDEELKAKGVDIACDRQVGMTAARSAAEESALNSWKSAHRFDLEHLQRLRPAFDSAVAGL